MLCLFTLLTFYHCGKFAFENMALGMPYYTSNVFRAPLPFMFSPCITSPRHHDSLQEKKQIVKWYSHNNSNNKNNPRNWLTYYFTSLHEHGVHGWTPQRKSLLSTACLNSTSTLHNTTQKIFCGLMIQRSSKLSLTDLVPGLACPHTIRIMASVIFFQKTQKKTCRCRAYAI